MRWLACHPGPNFSVQDLHVGWVEALSAAGEQVITYPLGSALAFYDSALIQVGTGTFQKALTAEQATQLAADRLAGALYKVRPDVLLLTSGFFLDPQLLDLARRDGVTVVLIATEQPYELSRELDLARHCDVALLTDPTTLAEFGQVTTAYHQPHSYRPGLHHPGPADPLLECDLSFVGTGYASRIGFLEAMNLAGLDVLLAGNWQQLTDASPLRRYVAHGLADCLDNEQTMQVYRSTRVGLNLYRREAESPDRVAGWATGPREIEMAAIGCFFLRDPRPEGDELFPSLPTFTSPAQASDQLRWWLARPDERRDAALKAREAIADRTFFAAATRLLHHLESR
jgi:spore maturation protein CgeB